MQIYINRRYLDFILKATPILIVITIFISVIGSLFFEYYLKFTPCYLCWLQRIFWYPLLIIWLAPFARTVTKIKYTAIFSILGGIVALYHSMIQALSWPGFTLCQAKNTTDCTIIQIKILGLSIPNLSLVGFVMILMYSALYLKLTKLLDAPK